MVRGMKQRIYRLLESSDLDHAAVRRFRLAILLLIALNVLVVILETVDSINAEFGECFHLFEIVSVVIFTIEYGARLWVCTLKAGYRHPVTGRLRFALTPLALIDLIAILPYFLPLFFNIDLRCIRAMRLFRIFRILKIGRYSESMKVFVRVFRAKKEELLITLFTVFVMLVISSSVMYAVENEVQPEKFSSIPATMWWALITLTTVGYGDVFPVTIAGKILGGVLALLGVGLFALPAAILASAFSQEIRRSQPPGIACPHCGKMVADDPLRVEQDRGAAVFRKSPR